MSLEQVGVTKETSDHGSNYMEFIRSFDVYVRRMKASVDTSPVTGIRSKDSKQYPDQGSDYYIELENGEEIYFYSLYTDKESGVQTLRMDFDDGFKVHKLELHGNAYDKNSNITEFQNQVNSCF